MNSTLHASSINHCTMHGCMLRSHEMDQSIITHTVTTDDRHSCM